MEGESTLQLDANTYSYLADDEEGIALSEGVLLVKVPGAELDLDDVDVGGGLLGRHDEVAAARGALLHHSHELHARGLDHL